MKVSTRSLPLLALVSTACFAVHAADWDGVTVGATYFQPDLFTPFPEANSMVGGTVELSSAAFGFFSVDYAPTKITVTSLGDLNLALGSPTFAGFRFYDANSTAPSLVSTSINGLSSITGANLSSDANKIEVNFAGLSLVANTSVVIDLHFESVPEASTYAAGLAALPALGLWWRRRSAQS